MSDRVLNGNFYFPVDGHFVSQKQMRINEILQDYNKELQLQWIPPDKRSERELAFRVVHFPDGKPPYAICFAEDADERLLAKVFQADQTNSSKDSNYLDNYNAARELVIAKEEHEQRQEDHEFAAAVIRNTKSHFRHGGVDFERAGRSYKSKTYIW